MESGQSADLSRDELRSLARALASADVVGLSRPFWAICGGALQLQVSPNSRQPMASGKEGLCGPHPQLVDLQTREPCVVGTDGSKGKQRTDLRRLTG